MVQQGWVSLCYTAQLKTLDRRGSKHCGTGCGRLTGKACEWLLGTKQHNMSLPHMRGGENEQPHTERQAAAAGGGDSLQTAPTPAACPATAKHNTTRPAACPIGYIQPRAQWTHLSCASHVHVHTTTTAAKRTPPQRHQPRLWRESHHTAQRQDWRTTSICRCLQRYRANMGMQFGCETGPNTMCCLSTALSQQHQPVRQRSVKNWLAGFVETSHKLGHMLLVVRASVCKRGPEEPKQIRPSTPHDEVRHTHQKHQT